MTVNDAIILFSHWPNLYPNVHINGQAACTLFCVGVCGLVGAFCMIIEIIYRYFHNLERKRVYLLSGGPV